MKVEAFKSIKYFPKIKCLNHYHKSKGMTVNYKQVLIFKKVNIFKMPTAKCKLHNQDSEIHGSSSTALIFTLWCQNLLEFASKLSPSSCEWAWGNSYPSSFPVMGAPHDSLLRKLITLFHPLHLLLWYFAVCMGAGC